MDGVRRETKCITCGNACGGCSWSQDFTPVEGWIAEPTVNREGVESFHVIDCPEYCKDRPLNPNDVQENCLHALAAAVVEQAIKDYRDCVRGKPLSGEHDRGGGRQKKKDKDVIRENSCEGSIKAIERFFRSDWFYTLCDCDGEAVVRHLQREKYLHRVKIARTRMGL